MMRLFVVGWVVGKVTHFIAGDSERVKFVVRSFYGAAFWNDGNEDFEDWHVLVRKPELVDFCRQRLKPGMQVAIDGEPRFREKGERQMYVAPTDLRITIEKKAPRFFSNRNVGQVLTFDAQKTF